MRQSKAGPAARHLCLIFALVVGATSAHADAFQVETVVQALKFPWSMSFGPDGQLYVTQRGGKLSRLDPGTGGQMVILGVPRPRVQGEAGLLGLALDPDFADNQRLYLCYSTREPDGQASNRLSRFRLEGQRVVDETILVDHLPGATYHNGCRVIVSPDGEYLFFSMGDAGHAGMAQVPAYLGGKIFRIELDGSIPSDNPFPDSPVWSYGHRNPQGLRFRPDTDQLWSTEHRPDTQDEINLIVKGGNYGWPICRGTDVCTGIPNYHPALAEFDHDDTVATSDLIFYQGDAFPDWKGSILFVTLKTGRLYRIVLDGDKVAKQEILIDGKYGRLRDIAEGPDGMLYISTDNGDNDFILRLLPE